ncbi:hypothetical protein HL658_34590 [Azospirillum sp. RWY-5-1]|uniref:Chemotaxis protein CheZ n=1 Tax=Azospirillum oleiclasticum TaxID=2735135 RepID=A0ABX2TA28_9PROT|nr:protein phosphatase CheZ [Azospirillum oleiclasticum]NYZ17701.1 hypothetical protein [Azospirillum oleiclasticum]NYZ21179.1 hypothetical protein [Azospirillum oleiclasticum]
MAEDLALADARYREIEASLADTPDGRAFLAEHAKRARTVGLDEVRGMMTTLQDAWQRHEAAANVARHVDVLRRELQDMSASIVQARREIAAIRPKDGDDRITSAANELDAIVLSTERASIEILGSAERVLEAANLLRKAGAPDALVAVLDHEVTTIFTACSFQDLTGQRTTKVVNALRYIEQRILTLMDLWGVEGVATADLPREPQDHRPDAHLLNGPTDTGIDQDEIDRLLNGKPAPTAAPARPAAEPAPVRPLDQSSIDTLFG